MRPRFRLSVGGVDVTSRFDGIGVSITVTDAAGTESDRVEIVVDDHLGQVAAPTTGALLSVHMGYEPALAFMGTYVIDEVRYAGWPQTVTIAGRAADQRRSLKERRILPYESKSLAQIFQEIAGRHGLQAAVSGEIGGFLYDYIGQHEESDEAFATRLGRLHGATVTIKDGRLIVVSQGQGRSASGASLGSFVVRRPGNLISYAVSWKDKPRHERIETSWFDRDGAEREVEEEGADAPTYRVREPFPDAEKARAFARSKAVELRRAEGEATFEIEGDPSARAEMMLICAGVRSRVDGLWSIERVEHRIAGAYTTTIHCKLPADGAAAAPSGTGTGLNWTPPN